MGASIGRPLKPWKSSAWRILMSELSQNSYRPNSVSAPGNTLGELLEERAMSQAELAERTGRPLKTINEIVKGKSAITSETAIQLERVLGTPAEFWNQREANYRAYLARIKEAESLSSTKGWLKQFPLKEMIARKWIPDCAGDTTAQTISVLNYFKVATPEQWDAGWTQKKLAFRKAMNLKADLGATAAWLRRGEILGEKFESKPFDKERLLKSLGPIRELTKEQNPQIFLPKIQSILADCGVVLIVHQSLPKVPVFGASYWLNSEKALIQLSNRGKSGDTLWFTLFHELCHVLYHSKKEMFVEVQGVESKKSPDELEADEFAAEKLIPKKAFEQWLVSNPSMTQEAVIAFAKQIGTHPGLVVGKLQHLGLVTYASSLRSLKCKYDW
ncbi:MAG: ImmA/IrrE family metallo-endopeptidase [Proteobacteria bacterium]|nr:MAG: ImmA/IrrE family metallo-endopeptidase [Pseudomonadota bacterium]